MHPISAQRSIGINAAVERVFAAACGFDVPAIMRSYGFLPGVASVEGHTKPWSEVGQQRLLRLTNKAALCEELQEFIPGISFTYRIFGFSPPLANLIDEGAGTFTTIETSDNEVCLIWRYSLKPVAPYSAAQVRFFMVALWPGYMRAALKRLKQSIEAP